MSINNKRLWLIVGGLTALVISLLFINHLLTRIDLAIYDLQLWFKSLFTINQQEKVVIVKINETSLEQIGSWPWPRSLHAQLLNQLNQAGVKTVGFDIIFDLPSQPAEDKVLAQAIQKTDDLFFPSVLTASRRGRTINIREINYPLAKFRQAGVQTGYVNLFPDRDGKIRRLHLVREKLQPLALQLARDFSRQKRKFLHRELLINFHYQADYFPQLSYYQVLTGDYPKKLLANKLVLVGPVDNTLGDYFMTPLGKYRPGIRIQAAIIDNYLENSFIYPASNLQVLIAILIVSLITAGAYFHLSPLSGLLSALFTGISLLIVATGLLVYFNFYLPITGLELAVLLNLIIFNLISYFQVEKQRTHLKTVFSRYLAPQIMEEVISLPKKEYLSGQRREITVLFVDLVGFTEFAETKEPETVVNILNRFFSLVTEETFALEGTLNKFLGDGAMILFGAPTYQPDHAFRAVKLAINLQRTIPQQSELPLEISIGINTGEAVVGNVGSLQRTDYTAVGDVVNKAARIEAAAETREILLGPAAYKLAAESFTCRFKKQISLAGKQEPTNLYRIIYERREHDAID